MAELVDVDKIWIGLGRFGRFQKGQLAVGLMVIVVVALHMFSIIFIGYRPSYRCQELSLNETTMALKEYNITVTTEYEKCSIKQTINHSGVVSVLETGCTNGWYYYDDGDFAKDRSFLSEWDLVCEKDKLTELSQTLVMIGQGFGAFIFTTLADKFGRKKVHVLSHIALCLVALATAFVPNYGSFAAMRMLTGAFQQGTGLTIAIINLELFPKEIRGYVEVAGLLFWTTGIAVITPLAYLFKDLNWRYLQICLACMSAWSLIEWWLMDESLRWLIANGRLKQAKILLRKACKINKKNYNEVIEGTGFGEYEMKWATQMSGKPGETSDGKHETSDGIHETSDGIDGTLNGKDATLLQSDKHVQSNGGKTRGKVSPTKQYTFMDLIKSKRLLITSLIMWFAWTTNSLTYYGIMLISSSLAGNRFLNFFLGSVVEYPAAFMEWSMINRYGRKPTAITFHCICGIALIIATILTTTAGDNAAMILSSTVFTLIGKFAITGSFSTIFLYTPELYPTNMRNVGIGLSSAAARIGGMVAPFSRNLAEVALWAPGLIFGCMCAVVSILLFWVPETNAYELPQTLEECEEWYRDNKFHLPCSRDRQRTQRHSVATEQEISAST